jgi:chromosome segregation and condensation protein ScpB
MIERSEMEAALEAILFVSSEPVPRTKLMELFDEEDRAQAAEPSEEMMAALAADTAEGGQAASLEDREEAFLREVAAIEDSADAGEPE